MRLSNVLLQKIKNSRIKLASKARIIIQLFKVFLKDRNLLPSFLTNLFKISFSSIVFSKGPRTWIALTEHLGDLVAAEPVAELIRKKNPHDHIIWVVDKKYDDLIKNNQSVDNILTVSSFTEWILLQRFFAKKKLYDLHLDGKVCDKHGFLYRKTTSAGINNRNYYDHGNLLHAFSRSAGVLIDDNTAPRLHLHKVYQVPEVPYLVFHTSSNNPKRDLSRKTWNRITDYIMNTHPNLRIIEVGFRPLIKNASPNYLDYTSSRDLSFIAELIRHSLLFIGIDSGFAHFANALNKEALIFIGDYNGFKRYMPYSGKFKLEKEKHIFYFDGELKDLEFNDVKTMIDQKLAVSDSNPKQP
jgi:heptosyltransferase III